jgi:hypothetical protein
MLPEGMIFYPLVSISDVVSSYMGISTEDIIFGTNRQMVFSKSRHIVRWILMRYTNVRANEYDFFEEYHRFEHSQMSRSTKRVDELLDVNDSYISADIKNIKILIADKRRVDNVFNSIFRK